jgi:hypothetical protein
MELYIMTIRKSSSSGIPFGNNAGRPANPGTGQLYSNGETQRLELYTSGGSWENIVQEVPGVSSITGSYSQVTGSGVISIYGTNFVNGAIAAAIGTNGVPVNATSTTFNSLVQLTATFTGLSDENEPYDIKVTNPSNLFGLLPDALIVNNNLSWTTSAGSLGTFDEQVSISVSAVATDPESQVITYSLASGSSLPSGVTLNSSTGAITGTLPDIASSTTYTFTINASDGVNPAVARTFSITSQILAPATLDLLIVAGGGGGGGGYYGGGGGAGGVRQLTGISRTSNQCTLTIGSGGAGGTFAINGTSGQNSSLAITSGATYSASGGGGGSGTVGGSGGYVALTGGSGGGGSLYKAYASGASGNAGSYSPVEGYAGGTGSGYPNDTTTNGGGAGGGGAGGVGESVVGAANKAGQGGIGIYSSITGSSVGYGGGGGGGVWQGAQESGAGATYGGGRGSPTPEGFGSAGTANTGGGGGAGSGDNNMTGNGAGGSGGSGVIVIAYPDTFRAITTIPGTLTYNQPTRAGYRVYRFTAGTGTITF